jgi:hypothetical protein
VDGADILAPRTSDGDGKTARAEDFLAASLADGEWHDSAGLKTIAATAGVSDRTLQRAAKDLDVETDRRGFPASTWWRLPQSRQPYPRTVGATGGTAQPCGLEPVGTLVAPAPSGEGVTGATVLHAVPGGPCDECGTPGSRYWSSNRQLCGECMPVAEVAV